MCAPGFSWLGPHEDHTGAERTREPARCDPTLHPCADLLSLPRSASCSRSRRPARWTHRRARGPRASARSRRPTRSRALRYARREREAGARPIEPGRRRAVVGAHAGLSHRRRSKERLQHGSASSRSRVYQARGAPERAHGSASSGPMAGTPARAPRAAARAAPFAWTRMPPRPRSSSSEAQRA